MDLFSIVYVVLGTVTKEFIVNCFVNIVDVRFGHFSLLGKWLSLLLVFPANLRSRREPGTTQETSCIRPTHTTWFV
jgi:hypothetical protein